MVITVLAVRWYRLGQDELRGYLILFDPHAQTRDRWQDTSKPLSHQVVRNGSIHITAHQFVQLTSAPPIELKIELRCHVGWLTLK